MQWKAKTVSDGHIDDIIWYIFDNILCKTNPPKLISHRIIGLEIEDFMKASEMNSMMN